ncbi:hypothetical protein WOLCODRAFT_162792 [Wolfiporia cocos MD-104 SS10]|uniref:Uncharacterized protein n=1 Tax=Wolfiporia cocos (strain MD-104) TaxID=742152 RepID=A0A2H3JWH4_WOLCO|nr:hypothetical protein WOLCODRAFT_162792 [Wolfiporia cocos MD-104 SS10]
MSAAETKLALPAFLKVLTSNNVPPSKAIAVAGKIYKTHGTPSLLAQLTDAKLRAAGVDDKELRKLVLAAIRKAGFKSTGQASSALSGAQNSTPGGAGPSSQPSAERPSQRRKRKRDDERNEFLPDRPSDEEEGAQYSSLEFNEILDEQVLSTKFAVVNRAPIMMAWAFVVSERLGFQREEALSIASVYTEMNAITKGVSLGIFDKHKGRGMEASVNGSQPYVDLMGRRPLYRTASGSWRALSAGSPAPPSAAYAYIARALRQTARSVLGALRLLAASYAPAELARRGFALYAEFRPDVRGWGERGELRCAAILALRGAVQGKSESGEGAARPEIKVEYREADGEGGAGAPVQQRQVVKEGTEGGDGGVVDTRGAQAQKSPELQEPPEKKQRGMTLEEYEAALDADPTFDGIDLNFDIVP